MNAIEAYFFGKQTMSDSDYDKIYGDVFCGFVYDNVKKKHPPMKSIRKSGKFGVWDWFVKIKNQLRLSNHIEYAIQKKYDGIAIAIVDGVMVTRGDGETGNVIESMRFPVLNTAIYGELYSINGRNYLCSKLFSKQCNETFRFVAYDIDIPADYKVKIEELRKLGFETPETKYFTPDTFENFSSLVDSEMRRLSHIPSDGIVLKICGNEYREKLGNCKTYCNHAIAIKG